MRHANYLRLLLTTLTVAVTIHAGVGQPDGSLAAQIPVPGAFSKLSPPNGALYSSSVPLTWSPSANAASYEYCIDFINDNFCNSSWTNVGNNTSVIALVIGYSDFWWQVRARNGNNVTTASEGWWKLRIVSPPADFSKTAPLNSATNQSISVLLQWTASFGMTRYEYCRDTVINNTCDGAWVSTGLFASVVLEGLVPASTYEWQVRAVNPNGITTADGGTWWRFSTRALPLGTYFFEDLETSGHFGWGRNGFWGVSTEASHSATHAWNDSPGFPYDIDSDTWIDSPAIDVSRATNPQLRFWHRHDIAAGDEANIWVSPDDGFTWTHLKTFGGSNLSWHPAVIDLTPYAGVTHLRISFAVWSNGDLATGDGWHIDDVVVAESGAPGAFSKTSPPSDTTGMASAATLSWGLSGGAVDYEYCIDLTNNNICDSGWISTGSDTAVNISLNSSTSYYWQVRAVNGAGVRLADAGSWWAFSTAGPPLVISHPQSRSIGFGQLATLAVAAAGSAPFSYQWYQGTSGDTSAPIAGATAASYTTPALITTKSYWVRVTNAVGSADSATATIMPQRVPSDMNGDGMSDLIWRNSTTGANVIWSLNGTTVTSQPSLPSVADPAWQLVATGDVNRDGRVDVMWRNTTTGANVVWYLDGATLLASDGLPTVGDRAWVIGASSDVNQDGWPDLIWRNLATGSNVVWYLNGTSIAGYATLPSVPDQSWQIATSADMNQDGFPDLIWRNIANGANLVWYLSNGAYVGHANLPPVADLTWRLVGAFDVNQDQSPDLIWRNTLTGANVVWYMAGTTFIAGASFPTVADPAWQMMGTQLPEVPADVNGDRHPDLVWRNIATGDNLVWYTNGVALLDHSVLPSVPDSTWRIEARADVNGDRHPDLIWRNAVSGANVVWFLNGTSFLGQASFPSVADTDWHIVAASDLNADTHPDLIWRNSVTGANVVWYLNGVTLLGSVSLTTVPDVTWTIVDVADMDGDTYPDLIWRNTTSGANGIWYLRGVSVVGQVSLPPVPDTTWQLVAVMDEDGDGHADLVWRNTTTGANVVWFMNGATLLYPASLPTVPDLNWTLRTPG